MNPELYSGPDRPMEDVIDSEVDSVESCAVRITPEIGLTVLIVLGNVPCYLCASQPRNLLSPDADDTV